MSQGALKTKTEISTLHRVGAYFSIPIALVVLVLVAQLTGLVHIISVYATIFVALAAYWAIQYFTLRHYVSNPILYATIMTIIAPFALAAEVFLWVMGMLA